MKKYSKRNELHMEPWVPGYDMQGVSVSAVDETNGSPKEGDMIAHHPSVSGDRWLVAKEFFKANYEEVKE